MTPRTLLNAALAVVATAPAVLLRATGVAAP
ncbi:MAG: hypothetical protein JWP53_1625 [Conexibacter sp.]|nr:hypothetical protein [Conexibacter sp.]